jgi:hypothetical protein
VSEQPDKKDPVEIEQVNAELKRSLKLCHSVVDELRMKLAANADQAQPANDVDNDEARHG